MSSPFFVGVLNWSAENALPYGSRLTRGSAFDDADGTGEVFDGGHGF